MKKHRRKRKIRCFLPGNTRRKIFGFGYPFSGKKYAGCFLGTVGSMAALSYIFRLSPVSTAVVCTASLCLVPGMFTMMYKNMYEQRKFEDVTAYMEQILYSFKRRAKILTSLEDTLALFQAEEGRMFDAIAEAVHYIRTEEAEEHLYREAFGFIEKEYGCARLFKIHDFLIQAEEVGGEFNTSADILLNDRKLWINRTYELQREKRNVRTKLTIGIGLSFLICGMTVYMLPKEFGITENTISQAVSVLTILCNMGIWYWGQRRLSKSLILSEEEMEYEEVRKQYEYVMYAEQKKEKKKGYLSAVLLLPLFGYCLWKENMIAAVLMAVCGILLVSQPGRRYKVSLKHLTKAVEKAFPKWLLGMSLKLQTDNVHVSLAKSISDAPQILREELGRLVDAIDKAPDSIQPYLHFMEPVKLPDVTSAMKVLYSMAEFGASDIGSQIGPLVERNAVMTDKAERLRAEDEIAGTGFLILLPMITGVMKMLADLSLVIVYILSTVSTAA